MERQRSFSVKSTSFIALSLTISSSLVFFTFVSLWALRSTTVVLPPDTAIAASALSLNYTIASSSVGFRSLEAPILIDTRIAKPDNASGSPASDGVVLRDRGYGSELQDTAPEVGIEALDGQKGDSPSEAPIFIDTRIGKPGNTSGSPGSSAADGIVPRDRGSNGQKIASAGIEALSGQKVEDCDLGRGKWVYDESYPLYTNWSCPFIDEGFNCGGNGRPDNGYMKWRWQPQDCQIPRFNATEMLEMIRGKRLLFVGDSMNRNQWESMMCMLMAAVRDPKKVYETHRRRITKEKGNYCFRFVDYKCTVEYYVTHFLVHESKARIGQKRIPTLRIDSVDRGSSRWRGADILVFNTAHWWSHYKTKAGINYYQEGNQVHPKLDVSTAFRRALTTWASWVDKHVDPRKTQVFFRSSAPSHFSGGEWNSGGHCREAKQPLETSSAGYYSEKNSIAEDVIKSMRTAVTFLNITGLSGYRIDAHPSAYGGRSGKGRSSGIEDCSHWCLPGVPDTWNELLYIHLQMKQRNQRQGTA